MSRSARQALGSCHERHGCDRRSSPEAFRRPADVRGSHHTRDVSRAARELLRQKNKQALRAATEPLSFPVPGKGFVPAPPLEARRSLVLMVGGGGGAYMEPRGTVYILFRRCREVSVLSGHIVGREIEYSKREPFFLFSWGGVDTLSQLCETSSCAWRCHARVQGRSHKST